MGAPVPSGFADWFHMERRMDWLAGMAFEVDVNIKSGSFSQTGISFCTTPMCYLQHLHARVSPQQRATCNVVFKTSWRR
jgi:hypothetical protein